MNDFEACYALNYLKLLSKLQTLTNLASNPSYS
jgi:hypothetical protein